MLFYKKVRSGEASVVSGISKTRVYFINHFINPIFEKAEKMNISLMTIEIDRRGPNGLICKDNIRTDIAVTFLIRVNPTTEDVKLVASMVGCERACEINTLETLFSAKLSEALKTVGIRMDFEELFSNRESFIEDVIKVVGHDLNGYSLENVNVDYLEHTPLQDLDEENMQDSEGIRKIKEIIEENSN
ncbi:MAG: hypothetical protein HRT89_17665 [Lentisphaeria bacterium]|nr:SPFH domain-containing protein [Lentisphaeria bacterium]NQZ69887.1 hypothetical protein [Lentisphaeria bacterium]